MLSLSLSLFQATRLLGIGPEKIILLDCRTKVLARSQATSDLIQVTNWYNLFPIPRQFAYINIDLVCIHKNCYHWNDWSEFNTIFILFTLSDTKLLGVHFTSCLIQNTFEKKLFLFDFKPCFDCSTANDNSLNLTHDNRLKKAGK